MYKFTNGFVAFDEETKNEYIKAGYKLVEKPKKEKNENDKDNKLVSEESGRSGKVSKAVSKRV